MVRWFLGLLLFCVTAHGISGHSCVATTTLPAEFLRKKSDFILVIPDRLALSALEHFLISHRHRITASEQGGVHEGGVPTSIVPDDFEGILIVQHVFGAKPTRRWRELLESEERTFKVVAIGAALNDDFAHFCALVGAEGAVLSDRHAVFNLAETIVGVRNDELFFPPSMVRHFRDFGRLLDLRRVGDQCPLSLRELEILSLVEDDLVNKQIAALLHLSLHTVKNHVHHIIEKLGVENRRQAVRLARQNGWI